MDCDYKFVLDYLTHAETGAWIKEEGGRTVTVENMCGVGISSQRMGKYKD